MLKRSETDRASLLYELRRAQNQLPTQLTGALPHNAAQHAASSSSMTSSVGTALGPGSHRVALRIPSRGSQRPVSHEIRSAHSHKFFTRTQQREQAMQRKHALRERKLEVDRLLQELLGSAREGVMAHALQLAGSSGNLKTVVTPRLSNSFSAPQLSQSLGGAQSRHTQERSSHRSLESPQASHSIPPISGVLSVEEVEQRAKSVKEVSCSSHQTRAWAKTRTPPLARLR